MPMRPLVGRGYAPDTRAVSEAVAPMANACDPRTKVRTKSRRGRSPDLRDPNLMPVRDAHASARRSGLRPRHPRRLRSRCAQALQTFVSGQGVAVRVSLGGSRIL